MRRATFINMIVTLFYPSEKFQTCYSRFHITFPRRVAKFVGKLGTRFRSSQLRGELDNQNRSRAKLRNFCTVMEPNLFTKDWLEGVVM